MFSNRSARGDHFPIAAGAVAGLLAALVYVLVLWIDALFGYSFFIPLMSMPDDLGSPWTVAPGATLLGATLGCLLRRTSDRSKDQPWRGAVLGALLAPLNVLLTLQVTLVAFKLRGGRAVLWPLPCDLREAVIHCLPVALPCGLLLGAVIGLLEQWYPRPAASRL